MDATASARQSSGHRIEIAALLQLFAGLFLLASLFSYLLPLLGEAGNLQTPDQNWCGAFGFYTAHYIFSFFGLAVFFPLTLALWHALGVIFGKGWRGLPLTCIGMSGIALAASGLAGTLPGLGADATVAAGGYLGTFVWFFCGILGKTGGALLLLLALIASCMAAFRLPLPKFRFQDSNKRRMASPSQKKPEAVKNRRPVAGGTVPVQPVSARPEITPRRQRPVFSDEEAKMLGFRSRREAELHSVRRTETVKVVGLEQEQGRTARPQLHSTWSGQASPEWVDMSVGAKPAPRTPIQEPMHLECEHDSREGCHDEPETDEYAIEERDSSEADGQEDEGETRAYEDLEYHEEEPKAYGDEEEYAEEAEQEYAKTETGEYDEPEFVEEEDVECEEEDAEPEQEEAYEEPEIVVTPAPRPLSVMSERLATPTRPMVHTQVRPEPPVPKPVKHYDDYVLPSVKLLAENPHNDTELDNEHYYKVSDILVEKLMTYGVQGEVVGISPGPVVTTYEFKPAPGVKIARVVSLADDLAMVLAVDRVRVVGSIPGKVAIGIEIPNPKRSTVYLQDILLSDEFSNARSKLTLALGLDVAGRPAVANLAKMPHLLIAGATGAGKSVAINAFIASILFRAKPDEVRLLMIDPKRIELSVYDDIPHLLHPVVVEAKMASRALLWAVREMERRYKLLESLRVKSFATYNEVAEEPLPYIVIIVDELADLMMVASKDVETSIARLAQMARAAGMHIVLATQRPSVDVLTGLIKANFPTRISFKVSSKIDSRTILDSMGAEHLLGMGDMLFLPPGAAKLQRIHGAFISEQETDRLVEYIKSQAVADYDESVLREMEEEPEGPVVPEDVDEDYDEKYDEAVAVVTETGVASISMVQRRLRIGYNRAARMIELMEREGIVGPADGSRPREVLVRSHRDGGGNDMA